jgi:hypothetical protein
MSPSETPNRNHPAHVGSLLVPAVAAMCVEIISPNLDREHVRRAKVGVAPYGKPCLRNSLSTSLASVKSFPVIPP